MNINESYNAPASKPPSSGFATGFYAASAGLDLVAGVMGYLSAQNAASIANSRADMIRTEAEFNATRYAEQSAHFLASQKMAYVKSGVRVTGSVIDVLDETARVASANLSAIRAGAAASAMDEESQGSAAEVTGRNILVGGIGGAAKDAGMSAYASGRFGYLDMTRNNQNNTGFGMVN